MTAFLLSLPVIIPITAGLFFLTVAGIGAIRLPDFYSRSHAIGVTDTLGTLLILLGTIFYYGWSLIAAKLVIILVFIYIANPTVTHILVRAAMRSGLPAWPKTQGEKR